MLGVFYGHITIVPQIYRVENFLECLVSLASLYMQTIYTCASVRLEHASTTGAVYIED